MIPAGVTVVHTDKWREKTWLCIHLPIIWRLCSVTLQEKKLLFITSAELILLLQGNRSLNFRSNCLFSYQKMKHKSKSKAWQKMFSFKKEKGMHTNTCNICTSIVLPTIDSLISSNSKASSVFSWGQKMLFKTKIFYYLSRKYYF